MAFEQLYSKDIIVFQSAARTAHANSADISTSGFRNIRFDIDITAFTGTSITFTVQVFDRAKNDYVTSGLATAALAATGHTVLNMGPTIAAATNSGLNAVLPKKVRLVPSGTITSVTYSVTATLAP